MQSGQDRPRIDEAVTDIAISAAGEMADIMLSVLSDGLDHPELWRLIPQFVADQPLLMPALQDRLDATHGIDRLPALLLLCLCHAALGDDVGAHDVIVDIATDHSQSPLVQGVLFHIDGRLAPADARYDLTDRFCETPFIQADVLDGGTHLCCASWLQTSAGDMATGSWQQVWNSPTAQAIRDSVHDGSYRYCNKGACPKIRGGTLPTKDEVAARSDRWHRILTERATAIPEGPQVVNLAYDRTCNLSCPSCRVERYAADDATRSRYADLQDRAILPMLESARTVFVTGSGDPFASKNFRQLLHDLTPDRYPDLRFQIMTNGMLLTPRQWDSFPSLHGRVERLKISIDAATGPTHEALRRGARWPVMLDNMAFAGRLLADGLIENLELVFIVQRDNYREVGDAVDLAHRVGANGIHFARLTNWGTFTPDDYRARAVFVPGHAAHRDFVAHMQDPRLCDPIVLLGDLQSFVAKGRNQRAFAY